MYRHFSSIILRWGMIFVMALLLGPAALVSAQEGGPVVGDPAYYEQGQPIQHLFSGCRRVNVEPVNAAFEQRVVELVNQHRASKGLSPLRRNTNLDYAARYHAADMAADRYFDHDSYDGAGGTTYVCDTWTRLNQFYTGYNGAGENIAAGYGTPEAVMQGWLNSEGHRRNIERASFNEIGVGYYTGGPYGSYWVQDFGEREENEAALGGMPKSVTVLYGLKNKRISARGYDLQPYNSISSHAINWTVTKSGFDANWLVLTGTNGTTPSSCLHATPANIPTLYATTGEHTGALTFTGSVGGAVTVINSPVQVPVRLVVTETVYPVYIPGVLR